MLTFSRDSAAWKFREVGKTSWLPATVPGCVHVDLLNNRQIPDPYYGNNELALQWISHRDWEYSATFTPPSETFEASSIELCADGLDTIAEVSLNNRLLGRTDNMFQAYRWDIRPLLKKGQNTLRIRFASPEKYIAKNRKEHKPLEFNDPVGRCTVIRKQQCQFGWDWGPRLITSGIWRPIKIEAWSGSRIEYLRITQ